jgi:uncharacterized RDD family membrane protein YckC
MQDRAGRTAVDRGVYFSKRDYASVWRRIAIETIDSAVVLAATALSAIGFCYFVLLKWWRRTLGYAVGGVRIVTLRGERPSLLTLTTRFLFATFGPANIILDLLWIGNDPHRQALRDKSAQTYVIRKDAKPAGRGSLGTKRTSCW